MGVNGEGEEEEDEKEIREKTGKMGAKMERDEQVEKKRNKDWKR